MKLIKYLKGFQLKKCDIHFYFKYIRNQLNILKHLSCKLKYTFILYKKDMKIF